MKRAKLISGITLLAVMAGCAGDNKQSTDDFITVDINASYPEKELILQDFMDVEYVALETSDEFITQGVVKASGKKILLVTNWINDGDIFVFDWTGKSLRKINRLGQGGEEYTHITNIFLDEDNNEMFIIDYPARKIFVYDLYGNFHRSFEFTDTSYYEDIFNYDRDNLICYKGYLPTIENEQSCHLLISKKDGSITRKIQIPFKEIKTPVITKDGAVVKPAFCQTTLCNGDLLLSRTSSDTIYRYLPDGNISPFIVRTPSINSMDTEVFLFPTAITDRYYFMQALSKKFDFVRMKGFPTTDLVYDKQENVIFQYTMYNDDFSTKKQASLKKQPQETVNQKILTCQSLEASELIEAYKKGLLKGKLKEIAAELEEDSNPVIMLVKYKK